MPRQAKNEIGNKYGRLTVISRATNRYNWTVWLCICQCGKKTISGGGDLRSGKRKSCGCLWPRIKETVGKKYGRWTVLAKAGRNKNGALLWRCRCDCGAERAIGSYQVRSGRSKSCGCLSRELTLKRQFLPDGEAAFRGLFRNYSRHAVDRNLKFEIDENAFRSLTSESCHYCGARPSQVRKSQGAIGTYVYNGVDRKNSKMGYIEGNVVPCCFQCNKAKGTRDYDEFIVWAHRIAEHTQDYSLRQVI